jgi:hypothetical protein
MKKKIILGLVTITTLLLTTACNKVPQMEIDAANNALMEAEFSGSELYMPDFTAQTKDSLNAILIKIESKKSKWFASYSDEKMKLEDVKLMATQLKQSTEDRKIEIKMEIQSSLNEIKNVLDENKLLLKDAPKGKEGAAALEAIKEEIGMLEVAINKIMNLVETGEYLEAQSKVDVARDKTFAINTELKDAIAKSKQGRRG